MEIPLILIALLLILVILYAILSRDGNEMFIIPQNMVSTGDFHIEQPGTIADSGSFANDMYAYINGE